MTKKTELHQLIEKLPEPENVGDEMMYSAVQELLKLVSAVEAVDAGVWRSTAANELVQHRIALAKQMAEMTRLFAEMMERVTDEREAIENESSWSRLSADAFARDWASEADRAGLGFGSRPRGTGLRKQTAFMTAYSRGDVVLVPFDFSDRSGTKLRPAVVVSTDVYNERSPDVLVASLTGNLDAVHHVGDRFVVGLAGGRPSYTIPVSDKDRDHRGFANQAKAGPAHCR